ncbi:hypothetical protein [Kitasatospora sp. NPDC086791]|uniref:hypothetical protein n=1 Tax=Kitasatospora sp. NPDC086791 TaxID=3155178 RepID=UPI003448BB92
MAIRIFDYSENPRALLREIGGPLAALRDSQQLPVVHLRRGWLNGSHLQVVARPYGERPVEPAGFAAEAGRRALALGAEAPDEAAYLRRAEQLARWENVSAELLPRYRQGHVEIAPHRPKPDPAALAQAVDQIAGRFLEPVLASAHTPDGDLLPHLARVMALLARAHPRGISAGALPYRSHAEGIASATGNHVDLRARFAERFAADRALFEDALTAPVTNGTLLLWQRALYYAWGVAEALTASGLIDERTLQGAAGDVSEPPLGTPVRSPFIAEVLDSGLLFRPSYRHIAHRVVLNVLYTSLTCFGITPVQRYYLCYGLGEATDLITGQSSVERLRDFSRELA